MLQQDELDNDIDENDLIENIPGYTRFDDISLSTGTATITFAKGTNINYKRVFRWHYLTETDKYKYINNQYKITFTGNEEPGCIVASKCGNADTFTNWRGIRKGAINAFPNQVTLDMFLSDKPVNIFLYKNSMKITGCKKLSHITETFHYIDAHLQHITEFHGKKVYDIRPCIDDIMIEMAVKSFNLGHSIDLNYLATYFTARWGFVMQYDPLFGTKIATISYSTDHRKKNKDLVCHTFELRSSGKVRYTGRDYFEMNIAYQRFRYSIQEAKMLALKDGIDITKLVAPKRNNDKVHIVNVHI